MITESRNKLRSDTIRRIEQSYTDSNDYYFKRSRNAIEVTDKLLQTRNSQLQVMCRALHVFDKSWTLEEVDCFCICLTNILHQIIYDGVVSDVCSDNYIVSIHKDPSIVIIPLEGAPVDVYNAKRPSYEINMYAKDIGRALKNYSERNEKLKCDKTKEQFGLAWNELAVMFLDYKECLLEIDLIPIKKLSAMELRRGRGTTKYQNKEQRNKRYLREEER